MKTSIYREPTLMAAACAVVGVLAALGVFNSITGFPLIFSLVLLGLGLLSIWRGRPRRSVAARVSILLAGVAMAYGGSFIQRQVIEERRGARRLATLEVLEGREVPALVGLEPLNTDQATWDTAATLAGEPTVVTFWAVWCSPCWKEMDELEELYQGHRDKGLRAIAVTRFDRPDDAEERRSDFAKARRFLDRRGISYPTAITDDDEIYRAYRVPTPPAMVLVDREGRVVDFAISLESARSLMRKAAAMVAGEAT